MDDDGAGISGRRLTRLRTLGRGASGADVSLFAADDELVAVKSARAASGAEELRREGGILASLCSPYVLPCLGSRAAAGGEYQLFLEFAPGGSLADEVERNGGSLEECAVRAYAADVARGLAYLHGESVVHGDVKGRNVVIGADGWAKLTDFGCARIVGSIGPIGGTPAFMAPEVARGEEQGPAADVWALGCTVIEMATGRAPWTEMEDMFAAVHLIGYTDAVPQAPQRLSAEGKDFLDKCFRRRAGERWTAAQLLEHPFLALDGCGVEASEMKARWVSPKSTLDATMWESDADEDDKVPDCRAEMVIRSLAASSSALADWESDDGWIEVLNGQPRSHSDAAPAKETMFDRCFWDELELEAEIGVDAEVTDAAIPVAEPAEKTTSNGGFWDEELEAEIGVDAAIPVVALSEQTTSDDEGVQVEGLDAETGVDHATMILGNEVEHNVGLADAFLNQQQVIYSEFNSDPIVLGVDISHHEEIVNPFSRSNCLLSVCSFNYFHYTPLTDNTMNAAATIKPDRWSTSVPKPTRILTRHQPAFNCWSENACSLAGTHENDSICVPSDTSTTPIPHLLVPQTQSKQTPKRPHDPMALTFPIEPLIRNVAIDRASGLRLVLGHLRGHSCSLQLQLRHVLKQPARLSARDVAQVAGARVNLQ